MVFVGNTKNYHHNKNYLKLDDQPTLKNGWSMASKDIYQRYHGQKFCIPPLFIKNYGFWEKNFVSILKKAGKMVYFWPL